MNYKQKRISPIKDQLCLCKCPDWCILGFQIAMWNGDFFTYPELQNGDFDLSVEEWIPLNDDGLPILIWT